MSEKKKGCLPLSGGQPPTKSSDAAWDPHRGQPLALLQQGSAMSCSSMDKFGPGTILSPALATAGGRCRSAFCRFLQVVYRLISIPGETVQTDKGSGASDLRKRRQGSSPAVPKLSGRKMGGTQLAKICRHARRACLGPTRLGDTDGIACAAKTSAGRKLVSIGENRRFRSWDNSRFRPKQNGAPRRMGTRRFGSQRPRLCQGPYHFSKV